MVKTFIIGLVVLVMGLYMVTNLSPAFTLAAKDVYAATGDAAVAIPRHDTAENQAVVHRIGKIDFILLHHLGHHEARAKLPGIIKDVYAATGDAAVAIPEGFAGGSLDFASSPLAWVGIMKRERSCPVS